MSPWACCRLRLPAAARRTREFVRRLGRWRDDSVAASIRAAFVQQRGRREPSLLQT
jgi:hypothetical protein